MKIYNKLIRDKIPKIIEEGGKKYEVKVLDDEKYLGALNTKLQEELKEYYENEDVEELADLVEVVYSILKHKQVNLEEFEKIRLKKKENRGGFDNKLFLIHVED